MTQFERIDQLRDQFSIDELCRTLCVSPSGYYAWKKRQAQPSKRQRENARALDLIHQIHADADTESYGSPRMTRELQHEHGIEFSENRVARVMRKAGIRAKSKRAFRPKTTVQDPSHGSSVAPNRLAKLEAIDAPGQVLVSDITYIPTREGWLYLAVVMDLFSRYIMGWKIAEHMQTSLVCGAFKRALKSGIVERIELFHSDRGCQYTSREFGELLRAHRVKPSMSAQGYCYDNATCESFFATLKTELLPESGVFESKSDAKTALFAWVETFYNRRRRHSSLGYQSPKQFLDQHLNSNLSLN